MNRNANIPEPDVPDRQQDDDDINTIIYNLKAFVESTTKQAADEMSIKIKEQIDRTAKNLEEKLTKIKIKDEQADSGKAATEVAKTPELLPTVDSSPHAKPSN